MLWTVRLNVLGLKLKHTFHINEITSIELFPFSKMPQFTVKSSAYYSHASTNKAKMLYCRLSVRMEARLQPSLHENVVALSISKGAKTKICL